LYSEHLTKQAVEGFGDLKVGGQVICSVIYADDIVLLAKGKIVLKLEGAMEWKCGKKEN
jgi:hypothetical protein